MRAVTLSLRFFTLQELNYRYAEGDIRWTIKRTTIIASISLGAGVLASLLGIGGGKYVSLLIQRLFMAHASPVGAILSPVMLELGVPPSVTAATGSFMIARCTFSPLSSS